MTGETNQVRPFRLPSLLPLVLWPLGLALLAGCGTFEVRVLPPDEGAATAPATAAATETLRPTPTMWSPADDGTLTPAGEGWVAAPFPDFGDLLQGHQTPQ